MIVLQRERTSADVILYALYLYFLGLSFRSTSKAIQPLFGEEGKRSHVAVWKWVQRFNPRHLYRCKRISAFLIDETMLQIGYSEAWLWVAVEPIHKQLLGVYISRHRNMIVTERGISQFINQNLW
jgi:putative transposase